MSDGLGPFIKFCPITPEQVNRVSEMVKSKFSTVEMSVNPDKEIFGPYVATPTPGKVWVGFLIPREGVSMADFMGEFCKTLGQESTRVGQKERG